MLAIQFSKSERPTRPTSRLREAAQVGSNQDFSAAQGRSSRGGTSSGACRGAAQAPRWGQQSTVLAVGCQPPRATFFEVVTNGRTGTSFFHPRTLRSAQTGHRDRQGGFGEPDCEERARVTGEQNKLFVGTGAVLVAEAERGCEGRRASGRTGRRFDGAAMMQRSASPVKGRLADFSTRQAGCGRLWATPVAGSSCELCAVSSGKQAFRLTFDRGCVRDSDALSPPSA